MNLSSRPKFIHSPLITVIISSIVLYAAPAYMDAFTVETACNIDRIAQRTCYAFRDILEEAFHVSVTVISIYLLAKKCMKPVATLYPKSWENSKRQRKKGKGRAEEVRKK